MQEQELPNYHLFVFCNRISLRYSGFLVSIWAERGVKFKYYNLWFENTERLFPIHVHNVNLAIML